MKQSDKSVTTFAITGHGVERLGRAMYPVLLIQLDNLAALSAFKEHMRQMQTFMGEHGINAMQKEVPSSIKGIGFRIYFTDARCNSRGEKIDWEDERDNWESLNYGTAYVVPPGYEYAPSCRISGEDVQGVIYNTLWVNHRNGYDSVHIGMSWTDEYRWDLTEYNMGCIEGWLKNKEQSETPSEIKLADGEGQECCDCGREPYKSFMVLRCEDGKYRCDACRRDAGMAWHEDEDVTEALQMTEE